MSDLTVAIKSRTEYFSKTVPIVAWTWKWPYEWKSVH